MGCFFKKKQSKYEKGNNCMSANNSLDCVRNVEHPKQSGTRPVRMPGLSGMLLIPNELLAII